MTVSELLAILKNCPPDMEVEIMCGYDDHYTAGGVISGAFVLDYKKLYEDYKYIDSTNFSKRLVLHDDAACFSDKEKSCIEPLLVNNLEGDHQAKRN